VYSKYSPILESGKAKPLLKSMVDKTPFIETLPSGNVNFLYAFNGNWLKLNLNSEDEARFKKVGIGLNVTDPITYDLTLGNGLQFANPAYSAGNYKFDGVGYLLDYDNKFSGKSYLELDNLLVRGNLTVFDLLVIQKRFTNGSLFISNGAKVKSVNGTTITFEDPSSTGLCPFAANDLILSIRFKPDSTTVMRSVYATVVSVSGASIVVTYTSGTFQAGDDVARVGNTTDATRQGMVYLTADDTTAPYIDIVTGVNSWVAWSSTNKVVARLGRLKDLATTSFGTLGDVIGLYIKNSLYIDDGNINMGTTGYVRAGQTAYNTGSGFWLGYAGGVYKFSLGNSSTNYITWDNTTLTVAGTINITGGTGFPSTYYSASTSPPATPKTQDIWYQTDTGKMVRYNGSAWQDTANDTTLALTTGVSLTAGGITLGTAAAFKSGMTSYVDAVNAGFFLGLVTSVPKFKMQNAGSTKYFLYDGADLSLVGGTITGGTIQTAASGDRILLDGSTAILYSNDITNDRQLTVRQGMVKSASYTTGFPYANVAPGYFSIQIDNASGAPYFTVTRAESSSGYYDRWFTGDRFYTSQWLRAKVGLQVATDSYESTVPTFSVNSSGQITKINNVVTSGYVPISNGTHYEPRALASTDINANVSSTEFDYLDGVTSAIQTQLDGKQQKSSYMKLVSAYTLANTTALQKAFNVGSGSGGEYNSGANRTIRFNCKISLSALSSSSCG